MNKLLELGSSMFIESSTVTSAIKTENNRFYLLEEKKCFILKIFKDLCSRGINKLKNLSCQHRHYYSLDVTPSIVSLESYVVQNEI